MNGVKLQRENAVRAIFGSLLSAPLLLFPMTGVAQDVSPPGTGVTRDVSVLRSGVVRIKSTSVEGMDRTGTGFIVKPDADAALVLTASHVVESDKTPTVEFFTQQSIPVSAEVVHNDTRLDVALMMVSGEEREKLRGSLKALHVDAETMLTVGQDVITIGFHPGISWAVTKPSVASQGGAFWALVSGNISDGNSGSPLLTEETVVGMVTEVVNDTGLVIPAPFLAFVFKSRSIDFLQTVALPPMPVPPVLPPQSPKVGVTFKDCPDCPEMVVVPAGRFMMGSPPTEPGRSKDEGPMHEVKIPVSFAVGKYEVTRGQFARFVSATSFKPNLSGGCSVWNEIEGNWKSDSRSSWVDPGFAQTDEHPVVCISWDDAKAYAKWLAYQTGKPYRLLSEAEWEYAARAGTKTSRHWGADNLRACEYANVVGRQTKIRYSWEKFDCDDGYLETAPVGMYKTNNFGLRDMLGNVAEWVEDCWNANYDGARSDGSAWLSGKCVNRVLRGSAWNNGPSNMRSANRSTIERSARRYTLGFRVARALP